MHNSRDSCPFSSKKADSEGWDTEAANLDNSTRLSWGKHCQKKSQEKQDGVTPRGSCRELGNH